MAPGVLEGSTAPVAALLREAHFVPRSLFPSLRLATHCLTGMHVICCLLSFVRACFLVQLDNVRLGALGASNSESTHSALEVSDSETRRVYLHRTPSTSRLDSALRSLCSSTPHRLLFPSETHRFSSCRPVLSFSFIPIPQSFECRSSSKAWSSTGSVTLEAASADGAEESLDGAVAALRSILANDQQRVLCDFDDHLDDAKADWTNKELENKVLPTLAK